MPLTAALAGGPAVLGAQLELHELVDGPVEQGRLLERVGTGEHAVDGVTVDVVDRLVPAHERASARAIDSRTFSACRPSMQGTVRIIVGTEPEPNTTARPGGSATRSETSSLRCSLSDRETFVAPSRPRETVRYSYSAFAHGVGELLEEVDLVDAAGVDLHVRCAPQLAHAGLRPHVVPLRPGLQLGAPDAAPSATHTYSIGTIDGPAAIAQGSTNVTQHIGGDWRKFAQAMAVAIESLQASLPDAAREEFAQHAKALRAERARSDGDERKTRTVLTKIAESAASGGAGAAMTAQATFAVAAMGFPIG